MNACFLTAYKVLDEVMSGGAFSSIQLNKRLMFGKNADRALITKLVYGVLEKNIELQYVIAQFAKKANKKVELYLKLGTYCLMYLNIPQYATVNDVVELSKATGDIRLVGFVNATLKNIARAVANNAISYPDDELQYLSVKYSYPLWALKKLIKDYGNDIAKQIVSTPACELTNVRVNTAKISVEQFVDNLDKLGIEHHPAPLPDALLIKGQLKNIDNSLYTVQSLGSMYIARALGVTPDSKVLDCCAAPGGKSVYIKQLVPSASVTACDIHQHRVQLIQSYAERMQVDIATLVADMSVPCDSIEEEGYDFVLCDVPCSGFGVVDSRPDIKLFREQEDIPQLMRLQYAIADNCVRYLKKGGTMVYSTCTVFHNENSQVVDKLLKAHPELSAVAIDLPCLNEDNGKSRYQFLPDGKGLQGFFCARLQKN